MSETKHTPGQWETLDNSIIAGAICIAVIEDDGGYEAPADQRLANARLIAAAPELLEALEAILKVGKGVPGPLNMIGTQMVREFARAAIAKAKEGGL